MPQSMPPRVPPPAHGASIVKRPPEVSSIHMMDRSLTPDGRRDISPSFWRPPSLSPKHQSVYGSYSRGSSQDASLLKAYDGRTSAPPAAHQNSSSPSPVSVSPSLQVTHSLPPHHIRHTSTIPRARHESPPRVHSVKADHHKVRSDSDEALRIHSGTGSDASSRTKSHAHQEIQMSHISRGYSPQSTSHHILPASHPVYSPIPGYPMHNGQMSSLRTNGVNLPGVVTSHPPQAITSTKSNFMSVDSLISKPGSTRGPETASSSPSSRHKSESIRGAKNNQVPPGTHWTPVRDSFPPGILPPYGSGLIPMVPFQPNLVQYSSSLHAVHPPTAPPPAAHSSSRHSSSVDSKSNTKSRVRDASSDSSAGKKIRSSEPESNLKSTSSRQPTSHDSNSPLRMPDGVVAYPTHPFFSSSQLLQSHHKHPSLTASYATPQFNHQLQHPLTSASVSPFSPRHMASDGHRIIIQDSARNSQRVSREGDNHNVYLKSGLSSPPDSKPCVATSVIIKSEDSCHPGLNENSNFDLQAPSTSVSPTNSTHSTHSNSGGAKFLKKFWVQKYQDTSLGEGGPDPPASESRNHGTSSTSVKSTVKSENGTSANDSQICDSNNTPNNNQLKILNGGHPEAKPAPVKVEDSGDTTASGSDCDDQAKTGGTPGDDKTKRKKVMKKGLGKPGRPKKEPKTSNVKPLKRGKKSGETEGTKEVVPASTSSSSPPPPPHVMNQPESESSSSSKTTIKMEPTRKQKRKPDSDQTDVEDEEPPTPAKRVPAKRGRKPKVAKPEENDVAVDPKSKKENVSSAKGEKKVNKPAEPTEDDSNNSKAQRKSAKSLTIEPSIDMSGASFLQNKPCTELVPHKATWAAQLAKCRECSMSANMKKKKDVGPSIFCRFYHFRKLVFDVQKKELKADGFSKPDEVSDEDFHLWLRPYKGVDLLNREDAKFLIQFVGDHFCSLVTQERKACTLHMGPKTLAWKKIVAGVRETCDICETTLFNIHWVCSECGFVVCIDCYKSRKELEDSDASPRKTADSDKSSKDKDKYGWLLCNSKQQHEQKRLILTHIIAKSALWDVCHDLHRVREKYLGAPCPCDNDDFPRIKISGGIDSHFRSLKEKDQNGTSVIVKSLSCDKRSESPLAILADIALTTGRKTEEADTTEKDNNSSALRDLLSKPPPASTTSLPNGRKKKKGVVNGLVKSEDENGSKLAKKLNYFIRTIHPIFSSKNLPSRSYSLIETVAQYPEIPHDWFCSGKLLVLKDTGVDKNLQLFEQQWLRHQVMLTKLVFMPF